MKTRISRSFKDISLSFNMHPVTKDLTVIKDANAIAKSVRNIVQTIPKERFFNSILGSDVRSSLFDLVDIGTASVIEKQIEIAITNLEPRVDGLIVEVDPQIDRNEFNVTVYFNIIGLDLPTQAFTFILEATR